MTRAQTLYRGHKRLQRLIDFARTSGWEVTRTPGGHVKFTKPGLPPIYTSSTSSDHRAARNALAQLRRAEKAAARHGTEQEAGGDD